MPERLSLSIYFIRIAKIVSERATCLRKSVGCVLVDSHNHILATGYNGAPSGFEHCAFCKREGAESGKQFDDCLSVHAEENALIQCRDSFGIRTCYVTTFPCKRCLRMLMNTSCKEIVYLKDFAGCDELKAMWRKHGGVSFMVVDDGK